MLECTPELGRGRPIDLGSLKTAGQRGRYARISIRARTVVSANQACITQGRARKERKAMAEEAIYIGVDVAKSALDVAIQRFWGNTEVH